MKPRLGDVIEPHEALGRAERARLRERMDRVRLDCVLCDEQTFEVLAAIQLEDDRRRDAGEDEGDRFVGDALRSANMHLIRIPLAPGYSAAELSVLVEAILSRDFIETLTLTASRHEQYMEMSAG